MANRVYNFAAGPAAMPLSVLEKAAAELTNCGGCGMSVMEMSHRSPAFEEIIGGAEAALRRLMKIPDHYKVLFLQGGATLQFSTIPLNLYRNSFSADYALTGSFAKKAAAEAKRVGKVNVVASSEDQKFNYIPEVDRSKLDPNADYMYIVTNNTIYGTKWPELPTPLNGVPLVADASSNILSEPMDVEKFGLIYFGAQKNVGPAGLTVVIVRDDLIGHAKPEVPIYLDYKTQADGGSMYNTPPTFAIYMAGLVFEWMESLGGVEAMAERNYKKANLLYDFIDNSDFYTATVPNRAHRSIMNATFVLGSEELNKRFVAEAAKCGLVNLKGHRSVGGIRASIYNAMEYEGVKALVDFMAAFEKENR
ncbi:MAG: 3-phosphoserine/phosphohydroxythreonine transaminase [Clostridiales bacterium]|nr:3-phosphoserine/phosphohydroxythreonine transaminase [Clostridiales bacterium]